jgi:hypothetical protein
MAYLSYNKSTVQHHTSCYSRTLKVNCQVLLGPRGQGSLSLAGSADGHLVLSDTIEGEMRGEFLPPTDRRW